MSDDLLERRGPPSLSETALHWVRARPRAWPLRTDTAPSRLCCCPPQAAMEKPQRWHNGSHAIARPGLQCGPSWSPLGCSNTSSPLTRDVAKGQGLHGHSWLSSCPAVVSGASLRATLVGAAAELESAASQPNDLGRVPPPSECTFPPPSGGVMLSASLGYCGSDAGSFKVLARMQKNGILVHCWREREMV